VVAVAKAGMAAAFPAPNARTIADLDHWMDEISRDLAQADVPWVVNIVAHKSYERLNEELELIVRHKPPLVITALGSPRAVIDAVHSYGGLVFADVIDMRFARKALEAGVDGLVLVCAGAGGHTGALSPFAFVSAVRGIFHGPLVVGGAIGSGRAIRAIEMLGADLAYIGTPFIAAEESLAPDTYKKMVVSSTHEDLIVTNAITGVTGSWLKPSLVAAGLDPAALAKGEAPNFSDPANAYKRWKDTWAAGQGIDLVRKVEPAAEIVANFVREYHAAG
jgi:nitronate monooxygenase